MTAPASWTSAADRLASAATRRARLDAFARPAALVLASTGALVLAGKAGHVLDPTTGWLATSAGIVATIAIGLRAWRLVRPTSRTTAAWALDRIAGAHERGLTAALAGDDAARSIDGTPLPVPPPARLRPADGTVLALVAAMVALAGALWQGPAAPSRRAPNSTATNRRVVGTTSASAAAADAARKDAEAREEEAQAAAERSVRDALGLPALSPLDEARVAQRLADPAARAAALAAAPPGSAAAAALKSDDPGAAAALARALASGAAAQAERLREDAASLRTVADAVPIPPARRAVVARYLSSGISASGELPPLPSSSPAPK